MYLSEHEHHEFSQRGRIEVICGCMFSGKTEELIRRLKRATFARQRVEIFKPAIDVRYSAEDVVSHDSQCRAFHSGEHIGDDFVDDRRCGCGGHRRSPIF